MLKGEAYEYDATNRITARLRLPENETTTFGYDLIGQLTSETRSGYEATYTYDANENRLTRTINNETEEYSYDDGDKLLSLTKGQDTIEFFYDACGRLTAIEEPSEVVTELFWDYEDRLIGIEFPDTSVNSFAYNPFGARVSKTDSTGTRTYFRAGVGSRSAVLSDGAATYTPGISERRNNISRFYTLNAQGSTTQLTDSSQDEAASFSYDAWGNRIGTRNSDDPPFLFGGGFGYETDPDTGLIWNGEKIYLPDIGRFIARYNSSASTAGGYAPTGNNPNTSSSGPIAERVADIAEGGNNTIYVGFEPLDPGDPEYLPPVFAGFTGWAWGKDADQIKSDLVHAGVTAATETFKIVTSIPTATFVAGILDDFGKAAFDYLKNPSKWRHIFRPKHNLDELVKIAGSEENLAIEVIKKLQAMNLANNVKFIVEMEIFGKVIEVRGKVVEGIIKIGTFFVKH